MPHPDMIIRMKVDGATMETCALANSFAGQDGVLADRYSL